MYPSLGHLKNHGRHVVDKLSTTPLHRHGHHRRVADSELVCVVHVPSDAGIAYVHKLVP
jgi:hypothetical protein